MSDPVITRIAREDPARALRSDGADLLDRLLREIDRAPAVPPRTPARSRLAHVGVPALATLVAIAVVLAAVGLLGHRSPSHPSGPAARPAPSVSVVAVGSVSVAPGTETVVAHGGSVWTAGVHSLQQINASSGAVQARINIPLPGLASGVTFGAGSGWVVSGGGNTLGAPSLTRIDPADGRILATIQVAQSSRTHLRVLPGGIAFAAGRVWLSRVSSGSRGDVVSVDPATNRVTGRAVTVGNGPDTVLSAFGSLWIDDSGRTIGIHAGPALPPSVARIDPGTRQVTTEPFAGTPSAGFGSLWVRRGDFVIRYDPSTGQAVARIRVARVTALAFGARRVWAVAGSTDSSIPGHGTAALTQIDPSTNRIVDTVSHLPSPAPVAIAVSGHDLWIADYQTGLLHFRLTPH